MVLILSRGLVLETVMDTTESTGALPRPTEIIGTSLLERWSFLLPQSVGGTARSVFNIHFYQIIPHALDLHCCCYHYDDFMLRITAMQTSVVCRATP